MDILRVKVNGEWRDIPAIVGPKGDKGDTGDEAPFRKICDVTLEEAASQILVTKDLDGNAFSLRKIYVCLKLVAGIAASGVDCQVKLHTRANGNIYGPSVGNFELLIPTNAVGKNNNYSYIAEYNYGLDEWDVVGLPLVGTNRNGDNYCIASIGNYSSWFNPPEKEYSLMTAINLISVKQDAIGPGSRIILWGVDS